MASPTVTTSRPSCRASWARLRTASARRPRRSRSSRRARSGTGPRPGPPTRRIRTSTPVTPPEFTDYGAIAGMPDWGFNSERASLDHIRSYAESSLHAYERFQGAEQAGSQAFQHAQSRAVGEDLLGFAHTLREGAEFIEGSAAQMRSEYPDVADRTVDQADIDAANAYVDRVRTTGYTAGEIAQLHLLGLSDDAIDRLKVDQTIYDPGDATPGALDAAFDNLAARDARHRRAGRGLRGRRVDVRRTLEHTARRRFRRRRAHRPRRADGPFHGRVDERGSRPAGRDVGLRRRERRDRNPGRHRRAHLRGRRSVHRHGDRDRRVRLGHEEQGGLARTAQRPACRLLHGDAGAGTSPARGPLRRLGVQRPGRLDRRHTSGTSATRRSRPARRRRTPTPHPVPTR